MVQVMQFAAHGQAPMREETPRSLADRLTYVEGIRTYTVRHTLTHIMGIASQIRRDFYVVQTTNAELAELMGVSTRTVQNRIKELVDLELSHVLVTSDRHGQMIEIDLSRYYRGGEEGGAVPHAMGGEAQNEGGVKRGVQYPTQSQPGTVPATCTGVTTTPPLEKEEVVGRKGGAVPSPDLHGFVRHQISSRGWVVPSRSTIQVVVDHLEAHQSNDLDRKACVIAILDKLHRRHLAGDKVTDYIVSNLCSDCQTWEPTRQKPAQPLAMANIIKACGQSRPEVEPEPEKPMTRDEIVEMMQMAQNVNDTALVEMCRAQLGEVAA